MRHSRSAATASREANEHASHQPDTIGCYLDEIGQHRLLDREEEARLGRTVRDGQGAAARLAAAGRLDPSERRRLHRQVREAASARRQLVESNLRLVVSIAKHYQHHGVDLADLIQDGNLGLIKAVDRFDPDLEYRFSTYATWWIRQAISRALDKNGAAMHMPPRARSKVRQLRAAQDDVCQVLGRTPTGTELAREVGIDAEAAAALLAADQPTIPLSAPAGDGDLELGDLLRSSDEPPDRVATAHVFDEELRALVGQLPPAQRKILTMRYGLDGSPPSSLSQTAECLGVSRQRVRQIEGRALRRLRHRPALAQLAPSAA
jgi:RNA polymerase sigma factor (sigma-70 family)